MKNFKKLISIALFALIATGTTNVWAMEPQPFNDDGNEEDERFHENHYLDDTSQPQLLITGYFDTTILVASFLESISIALFALIAAGTTHVWAMEAVPSNDGNEEDERSRENCCIDTTKQKRLLITDCFDTTILIASFLGQKDAILGFALVSKRHYIAAREGLSNINLTMPNYIRTCMPNDQISVIRAILLNGENLTANFPRLISINARGTQITDQTVKDIVTVNKRLEKLYLPFCRNLTNPTISSHSLQKLYLSDCHNLTNPTISSHSLQILYLMFCPNLTDAAVQTIAQNCPNLQVLFLSNYPNVTQGCIAELRARGISIIY